MRRMRFALICALICATSGVEAVPASADTVPWSGTATLTTSGSTEYSTNQSSPTYEASVSPNLSGGYYLSVYDDLGHRVCFVSSGGCSGYLGVAMNTSRTYTAYVSYGYPANSGPPTNDVRATSGAVTVTNLGYVNSSITLTTSGSTEYSTNQSSPTYEASVSPNLSGGYYLSVYDDLGHRVCFVSSGGCSGYLGVAMNTSRTYTAYVSYGYPANSGPPTNDVRATSGAVTVTNLGYVNSSITLTTSGSTEYSTNQSSPTYEASVSPNLSGGYYLSVYDDLGHRVCFVSSGGCSGSTGAPLNGTRTYTAYVSYGYPPSSGPPTNDVRATSESVSVTNVGWAGHFTSGETTVGDQAFSGATSVTFGWDQPLVFVRVDIVDSQGGVISSCSTAGSLECTAALALGPDESATLHAEARANTPGAGYVTVATSAAIDIAGMSADGYAEFLLVAPEGELALVLGAERAEQALALRTAVGSETFCFALGRSYPSNAAFRSTVPDVTLECTANPRAALRYLIVAVGVTTTFAIVAEAIDNDDDLGAPSLDPEVGGGFDDPDCSHYDFDGNCLDIPAANLGTSSRVLYEPISNYNYWGSGNVICVAVHVDPDTGVETVYELRGDRLKHIVEEHVAQPTADDSVWDRVRFELPTDPDILQDFETETLPEDYLALIQYLCGSAATGFKVASGPSLWTQNTVNIYQDAGASVGTDRNYNHEPTGDFTIITTPQNEIWSAFPGTEDFAS